MPGTRQHSSNNRTPPKKQTRQTPTEAEEKPPYKEVDNGDTGEVSVNRRRHRSGLRLRSGKMVPHLSDEDTVELLANTDQQDYDNRPIKYSTTRNGHKIHRVSTKNITAYIYTYIHIF